MLGHADFKATQLYTNVSIRLLKEVHAANPSRRPARTSRRPATRRAARHHSETESDD